MILENTPRRNDVSMEISCLNFTSFNPRYDKFYAKISSYLLSYNISHPKNLHFQCFTDDIFVCLEIDTDFVNTRLNV